MNPVRVFFFLLIIAIAHKNSVAQSVTDTIRFAESILSMEKKKIVLQQMNLSEAEKAAFWPVYDSYCNATQFIEMESHQILLDFARNFSKLTVADIERFSKRMLQNDLSLARVRIQYYKKFKRAITPQRATEFMQLDNAIRMMVRQEAQRSASHPLVASAYLKYN